MNCENYEDYYDVNYELKYNVIKEELLQNMEKNCKDKNDKDCQDCQDNNNSEDNESDCTNCENYTIDDIDTICYKLYIDEYSSVFKSDNFMDDKIDIGIRKVFELLMKNSEFKNYINNMTISYVCGTQDHNYNFEERDELANELDSNMTYFSFLSLFHVKLFYLTHQFICNYIKTNNIDRDIFEKIKHLNDVIFKK